MSWLMLLLIAVAIAATLFGTPFTPGVVRSYWGVRWPGVPLPLAIGESKTTLSQSIVPAGEK